MTTTTTPIICSDCGYGPYEMSGYYGICTVCGHEVTVSDVLPNLDPGESLVIRDSILCVSA